ncbi:MAG: PAS domain-containing sensor histidine kinase [Chloroflexi bacterium]|nr:PAS domain-containing sensor histidine kinase [Chloroflexota bacterium]
MDRIDEALVAMLMEDTVDALVMLDETGHIIRFNKGAENLFGYPAEEVIGQPLSALMSHKGTSSHLERIAQFVQSPDPARMMTVSNDIYGTRKDGSIFIARASISKFLSADGPIVAALFRNITEQKEVETALVQHNLELDAFAHTVAHDLKNPLGLLAGFADVLVSEIGEEDNKLNLLGEKIREYALRSIHIVDEILLLSSVRREDVVLEPIDMQPLLYEVLEQLQPVTNMYRGLIRLPERLPAAWGKTSWVEEVWINYLSNALKYGGSHPSISIGADLLEDGMVRYWVQDNGPGIPEEKQEDLFIEFNQLTQARTQGYGLGLSIVRRIVEKLGGEVGVESKHGEGSIFYFTLKKL